MAWPARSPEAVAPRAASPVSRRRGFESDLLVAHKAMNINPLGDHRQHDVSIDPLARPAHCDRSWLMGEARG
jgi:hypothetical protein